jgi:hypothetical protein
MNAPNRNTLPTRLRTWWASPPRSGMRRLIAPPVYRRPRPFAFACLAGGSVQAVAGIICLSYSAYGWAAFFLALAALNFAGGCWYVTIARSTNTEPGPTVVNR